MKTLLVIALLLTIPQLGFAAGSTPKSSSKANEVANSLNQKTLTRHDIQINVNGMVCAFCAQGILNAFENHSAIKNAAANLDEKWIRIQLKKGASLTDKKINTIIKDSGYEIDEIIRR